MSLLEAPPAPPVPPAAEGGGSARPRRRRRRIVVGFVVAALAATAGILGSVRVADGAALAEVQVFLDAKPLTCANPSDVTTVTRGDDTGAESYAVPAVKGALDLDCVLSVVILNGSDRDVDVDAVTLPYFGPASRMGIRSDRALTQQSEAAFTDDRRDVVYRWQQPLIALGPGEAFVYKVHLTSDGCRQAGSTFTSPAPIVTVSTGLASTSTGLQGPGFGVLGVKTSAQPCR